MTPFSPRGIEFPSKFGYQACDMLLCVTSLPVFDFAAFYAAFDAGRRDRGLGWYEFADELWEQSSDLNARRTDHPLCGGAVSRLGARGAASCQYALFMLRWLGRAPEDFLTGPVVDVGDVRLPEPGPGSRLRWDLSQLHTALNEQRQQRGITWQELADEIGCTPSRLTNLRTARLADMGLAMRVTQWLGQPAAEFIHPADWLLAPRLVCRRPGSRPTGAATTGRRFRRAGAAPGECLSR
jgi:hypothetical protein